MTDHNTAPEQGAIEPAKVKLFTDAQERILGTLAEGAAGIRQALRPFAEIVNEGRLGDQDDEWLGAAESALSDAIIRSSKAAGMATKVYKAAVAPWAAVVERVRGRVKTVVDELLQIEGEAKSLTATILRHRKNVHAERERVAREAEEAARRKQLEEQQKAVAAAAAGDVAGQEVHEAAAAEAFTERREAVAAAPVGPAPNQVQGTLGAVHAREVWSWTLTDIALVPDQYTKRVVDDAAVRLAIDAGTREIPGLEIKSDLAIAKTGAKKTSTKR